MPRSLRERTVLRPCPLELLVRQQFGPGFDRYVRTHDVVRIVPGVYADAAAWRPLPRWDRYLARVYAVRWKRPEAVFVLESAAALRGIPFIGDPRWVHVLADTKGGARISGTIRGHFFTDPVIPEVTAGFATTNTVDTTVDLARSRHPAYGLAVLDQAIRVHGLSLGEITATNDGRDSPRGRSHAMWAIGRATGIPESVLESISLAAIEWLGLARPDPQVEFDLGPLGTARADAYWRGPDVIGEADGTAKYRLHAGGVGEALIAEKKREDAMRRIADGYARWGWEECRDPDRLGEILRSAGVPLIRPRDNTRLRTLAALLKS